MQSAGSCLTPSSAEYTFVLPLPWAVAMSKAPGEQGRQEDLLLGPYLSPSLSCDSHLGLPAVHESSTSQPPLTPSFTHEKSFPVQITRGARSETTNVSSVISKTKRFPPRQLHLCNFTIAHLEKQPGGQAANRDRARDAVCALWHRFLGSGLKDLRYHDGVWLPKGLQDTPW